MGYIAQYVADVGIDLAIRPLSSWASCAQDPSRDILRTTTRGSTMQREWLFFVYMLASQPRGTIYIGVTNNLTERLRAHREGLGGAFTKKYKVHTLIWFEEFGDITAAIQREKSLKRWPRAWKVNLIERTNPHWQNLVPDDGGGWSCT